LILPLIKQELKAIENDTELCKKVLKLIQLYTASPFDSHMRLFAETLPNDEKSKLANEKVISNALKFWNKAAAGKVCWTCHEINRKLTLLNIENTMEYLSYKYDCILVDECQGKQDFRDPH
jgi:hypothetical protein